MGWWKSIPVQKGDVIFATCDAFFERKAQNTNTGINWNAFLFLNPNYALNNGENMMTPNNNLVGIGILPTFGGNNADIPKAYLIAQFYDENNVPKKQVIKYVTSANYSWNTLGEIQEIALENGRVEIFVANESNTKVYFDDLGIYKSPTPIVQENHYYPFGMNLVGIEKEGTPNHRFQFMGKEKESSFGLNWTETDWRSYDAQVGRFWQVDKLVDEYWDFTPYHYVGNNPVSLTDPSGLSAEGGGDDEFYPDDQNLDEVTITAKIDDPEIDNSSLKHAIDALGIGKSKGRCSCGGSGCGKCGKEPIVYNRSEITITINDKEAIYNRNLRRTKAQGAEIAMDYVYKPILKLFGGDELSGVLMGKNLDGEEYDRTKATAWGIFGLAGGNLFKFAKFGDELGGLGSSFFNKYKKTKFTDEFSLTHPESTITNGVQYDIIKRMSDEDLIKSVLNPKNGDKIQIHKRTGNVVDGNTRLYELQKRKINIEIPFEFLDID